MIVPPRPRRKKAWEDHAFPLAAMLLIWTFVVVNGSFEPDRLGAAQRLSGVSVTRVRGLTLEIRNSAMVDVDTPGNDPMTTKYLVTIRFEVPENRGAWFTIGTAEPGPADSIRIQLPGLADHRVLAYGTVQPAGYIDRTFTVPELVDWNADGARNAADIFAFLSDWFMGPREIDFLIQYLVEYFRPQGVRE